MTQSLVINGKEYLPSTVLATRFGYTSDYLGKLAREEKVLGTLIGRQWFIEPESLSVFLTQAEIAKKMRQEELRIQRRLERQTHEEKTIQSRRKAFQHELAALTQTAVVVICGLMLGGLGFAANQEGLRVHELVAGAAETFSFVAGSIVPSTVSPEAPHTLVAASAEVTARGAVVVERDEPLVFTTLPEFPYRERVVASSSEEALVTGRFSDEVRVIEHADGSEVIIPVFKSGDSLQQYVLTPVSDDTKNHE